MSPVIQRFAASLLPFLVTVLTAFTVIPEAAYLEPGTWIQFAGLVVATAVSLLLPLVPAKWAGAAKTGGNVLVAVFAAIITYVVQGDFTTVNVVLVIIAGINSLASEIGVQIRTSAPAKG